MTDIHSLQLESLGAGSGARKTQDVGVRKGIQVLLQRGFRRLRLNRRAARPFDEDTARWAYLSSIRRLGPTL